MNIATEFLNSAVKRFAEAKTLGDKTFAVLSEEELHRQPNDVSNSVAVIIQHLHGNMLSRWTNFLTEDGDKPWRQRDAEFEEKAQTKEALMELWEEGWRQFLQTLRSLSEDDLLKTVTIRQQPLLVIDAINRQLAHYSYHVGQIVYLGRWLKGHDWQSLSIPKGQSNTYPAQLRKA